MRHRLSQAFHNELVKMAEMHDKKQADYGRSDDPFANVRASEDFGISGWVGALIRMNDKMRRLQKAASGGKLVNESVEDSFLDLAVYAVIGLVLFKEEHGAYQEKKVGHHEQQRVTRDHQRLRPAGEHQADWESVRKGLFP